MTATPIDFTAIVAAAADERQTQDQEAFEELVKSLSLTFNDILLDLFPHVDDGSGNMVLDLDDVDWERAELLQSVLEAFQRGEIRAPGRNNAEGERRQAGRQDDAPPPRRNNPPKEKKDDAPDDKSKAAGSKKKHNPFARVRPAS